MKKLFQNVFFQCFLFLLGVPLSNVLLYYIYSPKSLIEVFWASATGVLILFIIVFAYAVAISFRKQ